MSRETRLLEPKEIRQVEAMAGLGLPVEQIALILGISKKTLERRAEDQDEVKDALLKGRAVASMQVRQAAFKMAVSGKHVAMTIFWLKVREGWREKDDGDGSGHQPIGLAYQPKSQRSK